MLIASALFVGVAPSAGAADGGQALWHSGFEGGLLDGWRGIQQLETTANTARTDTDAPREGLRSARFEIQPGDALLSDGTARQQIWDAKNPDGSFLRFTEGQDLYFGFSLRLREDYPMDPGKWQVLASWYSGSGQGPLKLSTAFESDQFRLEGPNGNTVYWRGPVVKGAWLDFVVRVKFSTDPTVGFIEVWYKRPQDSALVKQTMSNGTQRQRFATMESTASYSYLKAGLYRDRSFTTPSVAWFDAIRFGDSLKAAAPR
jgi:hypothetical protein